jgi:hypothetical protein
MFARVRTVCQRASVLSALSALKTGELARGHQDAEKDSWEDGEASAARAQGRKDAKTRSNVRSDFARSGR